MAHHPSVRRGSPGALALIVLALAAAPALAMTSHAGWPPDQHLVMDRGPAGVQNTLRAKPGVHNYLLGGYGNDTIIGSGSGDVIWGDYHPSGWPAFQSAVIHAGNGRNVIYANDTVNHVWTGTNPATVVHAHEGSGVIHCESGADHRVHEPPRPPPLPPARLQADQLLLGRLLSRLPAARHGEPITLRR